MRNTTEKMSHCPAQLWTEFKCRNIPTCKTEQDLMGESVSGLSHAVPMHYHVLTSRWQQPPASIS